MKVLELDTVEGFKELRKNIGYMPDVSAFTRTFRLRRT